MQKVGGCFFAHGFGPWQRSPQCWIALAFCLHGCSHGVRRVKNARISAMSASTLYVRTNAKIKAAVEKAAAEDRRSVNSYIEKVLIDRLEADGFLRIKGQKP
jgi:hypothetical protein